MIRDRIASRFSTFGVRGLGRFVLTLAALAFVLAAAGRPAAAAPVDNQPTDTIQTPPSGVVAHRGPFISAEVKVSGTTARWVIKGYGFSAGNVGLIVVDPKSGDPAYLVDGFQLTTGPSFVFTTDVKPCKGGGPITDAFEITAEDWTTGKLSNTIVIATCS
jgi:hypothetical protein